MSNLSEAEKAKLREQGEDAIKNGDLGELVVSMLLTGKPVSHVHEVNEGVLKILKY